MEENIESSIINDIKRDEIVALWRKNYEDNKGIYNNGVVMPPPLYDEDVKEWIENKSDSCELTKIDKDKLKKFYNADLVLEIINLNEENHKRCEENHKRHEEWLNSDEGKKFMESW